MVFLRSFAGTVMKVQVKNNRQVLLQRLGSGDYEQLFDYLQLLGPDTMRRFGPHPFDRKAIIDLFENQGIYLGYIARDAVTLDIIAYSVIKIGYLEHDGSRLRSYGLEPDQVTDCTLAPSVADQWQSLGVGNQLFSYILTDLKEGGIKRVILWGGVQCDNEKAVSFYIKNGFRTLGQFEHNGLNRDMVLDIV